MHTHRVQRVRGNRRVAASQPCSCFPYANREFVIVWCVGVLWIVVDDVVDGGGVGREFGIIESRYMESEWS